MSLYPKQQEVANNLIKAYQNVDHIGQGHLYVSGEMGVGKTYIASYLVSKLKPSHTLIVAPKSVLKKWQTVLKEYTDLKSEIITKDSNFSKLPEIAICSSQNYRLLLNYSKEPDEFKTAIKDLQNKTNNARSRSDYLMIKSPLKQFNENALDFNDRWNFLEANIKTRLKKYSPQFDFIIVDEVHLLKPSTLNFATVMGLLMSSKSKFLGLTGTIFNQNISNLYQLLFLTNPLLMNPFQAVNNSNNLIYKIGRYDEHNVYPLNYFVNAIWKYIGAQISLDDINKTSETEFDLTQIIMPLKGLALSRQQELWKSIASKNMKTLNITSNRINTIVNNYLDLPSNKQPIITTMRKINSVSEIAEHTDDLRNSTVKRKSYSGMYLKPIPVDQTAKFKQCQNILDTYPQKTIIFVQDEELIKPLSEHLKNSSYLPKNVNIAQRAKYINDLLGKYQSVVLTSKTLAVGVDLNKAQNVIWYQVPSDVSQILQAQRRVLRLSDQIKSSKVWYLYYKDTSQEDVINEVANSAVNNSAVYNQRRTDNLARMSKILFGGIDEDEY